MRTSSHGEVALLLHYPRANKNSVNVLLGAIDRHGVPVDVYLDFRDGYSEATLTLVRRLASKYRTVVLGYPLFTTQIPEFIDSVGGLFSKLPGNVLSVAGGPHPTGDPLGTLRLGFQAVFLGEAEASLAEFLNNIVEGEDPLSVDGIAYLEGEKVRVRRCKKPVNLDYYPPYAPREGLFNPIEITRGCPYRCAYCQTPRIFGGSVRHRSIESIVEWVDLMFKRGYRDIRFITPNALGYGSKGVSPDISMLESLLSRLRRLADFYSGRIFFGSFPSEVRPEFVDRETVQILKRYVDNRRIIVGAQSGSERLLKIIGRGHGVEEVINAVRECIRAGFQVDVDLIFGLPGETDEDVEATISLMRTLTRMGARIHAHTFIPLPGTPLWCKSIRPLNPKYRREILKILGKGLAYGYWERQERLAHMLYELKSKGIITPRLSP